MDSLKWDLSSLYAGFDDPAIARDEAAGRALATDYASRWRGRIAELSPAELAQALTELEDLYRAVRHPGWYASLRYAVATDDEAAQAAQASTQAFEAEVNELLAFFTVELAAWGPDRITAPELAPFAHYLAQQNVFAPYTLSEAAEQAITRKDVTGKSAWVNLYTQITGGISYELEVEGEVKTLTRADLRAYASSPDRDLRRRSRLSLAEGFEPHRDVLTFVFNTLFEDHRLTSESRGYDDIIDYTVLRDELTRPVVEALLDTTTSRYDIVHRLHALRADALGLDDYGLWDVMAPAFGDEPKVEWEEARALVIDAFAGFDPRAGSWAESYLSGGRVDVMPRQGKSSGAFCSPGMPPDEPFVMLNHAGRLDDVFTLAHELGHAYHFSLARKQGPLNYWAGTAMAETASIFGELWLHEHLMSTWTDPTRQRQLLHRLVSDAAQSAFSQAAYVNWERQAHAARAGGIVASSRMCELWEGEVGRLFGPGVQLDAAEPWRWAAIPHFVFARFYCYSYAFGRLMTLGLADLWRKGGQGFADAYIELLEAGGSATPFALLEPLGVDLADSTFWAGGCAVLDGFLADLEASVAAGATRR